MLFGLSGNEIRCVLLVILLLFQVWVGGGGGGGGGFFLGGDLICFQSCVLIWGREDAFFLSFSVV